MENERIDERSMLGRLSLGTTILPPLVLRSCSLCVPRDRGTLGPKLRSSTEVDALIELALPDEVSGHWFAVEAKSRSTPKEVESALLQARKGARGDELPLVYVPYLSPEALQELESVGASGIDMCGNGIVIVPKRLWIVRTGQPNLFHDSRPLNNPYGGRSGMAARILLKIPSWHSLSQLTKAVQELGGILSLAQTSKTVSALEDDRIVKKTAGQISLTDPIRLLDKLGAGWDKPDVRQRRALRLPPVVDVAKALATEHALRWAVTGESSVNRYITFSQGGPRKIAVSNIALAESALQGTPEHVPNFASVELIETDEPGYFFDNQVDAQGMRWASELQVWLELNAGDARQQEAARDLRSLILKEIRTAHER